jgi:amidohydrolase
MKTATFALGAVLAAVSTGPAHADLPDQAGIRAQVKAAEQQVIAWRRDIHQHPELGNRETRTSKIVADHLKSLGMEVRTGLAHTGVVGVLKGGKPGPVVALRADMDALPVTEPAGLAFASTAKAEYNGQQVGVMHACGHDAHTAILMGAAKILAGMKADLPGTVVFLFQPAEEGVPSGETGGAKQMVADGALANPKVDAVFGLHVWPGPPGQLMVRSGGTMAGSDQLYITVNGKQTHGAMPSKGVDPVTASAQVILALQTMVTRQMDAAAAPSVVSVGKISGGIRHNIIPDKVEMAGTIRHLDPDTHDELLERVRKTVTGTAAVAGATADVKIEPYAPPVFNPSALVARMTPTLKRVGEGGGGLWIEPPATMGAEDFAWYQKEVPGMFFGLGINKPGIAIRDAAPNHSPNFFINEDALRTGVEAMVSLAVDYLAGGK